MKKPAKRAGTKSASKVKRAKSKRSARSRPKHQTSAKTRTSVKRPAPTGRSKLKTVATKAAKAAAVAAGLAALDTALGELGPERKTPAERRSDDTDQAQ